MFRPFIKFILFCLVASILSQNASAESALKVTHLRCEYLENPLGIDAKKPRLSWRLESSQRGQAQSAYRILVASSLDRLAQGEGDLWDSGKVDSSRSLHVTYAGQPLKSEMQCFWKVQSWNQAGEPTAWSETASWSMGLLNANDWVADYISLRDESEIHADPQSLHLPAARQYRKSFSTSRGITRATVYSTALGIYELYINGQRLGDAHFAPGWTDYHQRAYYNTHDVTSMMACGDYVIGAWVADGWYSGYVGFGLLTGMGTEKTGRAIYGKTPAVMIQLVIEYADGSRQIIGTDTTWKVTGDGPIQEADLLMGESYDARKEMKGWAEPYFDDRNWQPAVLATENGEPSATFYQFRNPEQPGGGVNLVGEPRNLGFRRPKLEAFPGAPVRITEEVKARRITPREPGTYVIDLGQNFAGNIRLKVNGPEGHQVKIRYGEMLHPDGRLMTENLRKARATDFYTCRGDSNGEVYQPRFTFHGFQFVELSNFPGEPDLDTITGLVMHSDTPMTSTFQCSDSMVNQLFSNVLWTQRSNFLDLPTDCPQRDERMGWTGDAQAYVGTAAFNADIGAFYTKWLRELMESQRPSGVFPGYAPMPFQHGWDFGTAWTDAGVICPWTIWQVYDDTRVIEDCWEPMTRFMQWRKQTSVDDLGIAHGNAWGDWLTQGASTPLEYIDSVYYAISAKMMAEMAQAIGREEEARAYKDQLNRTKAAFAKKYLNKDGTVNVRTQTAQALALFADLIPDDQRENVGRYLAELLFENGNRMATGFLGTRPLLPVLSSAGQNDLAAFLLQSREFPSWGYEIENGATTIWERWDSYTKEDAFGRHNAAMNSFSHYAFGAVCEWMFHTLAGIQSDGPGYKNIIIKPAPPSPGSNAIHQPIDWVKASYESIRGTIRSDWKIDGQKFRLNVSIPANTKATVYIPTSDTATVTESDKPLTGHVHVRLKGMKQGFAVLEVQSGNYEFAAISGLRSVKVAIKTFKPKDTSLNPENIDLAKARKLLHWDFTDASTIAQWNQRNNLDVKQRDQKTYLVATGDDPQIATTFASAIQGKLVVQLRIHPSKGTDAELYWAAPKAGFNAQQHNRRMLMATEHVNDYLFSVDASQSIDKLRFDPFATYDEHANRGEMEIESITIYSLPE